MKSHGITLAACVFFSVFASCGEKGVSPVLQSSALLLLAPPESVSVGSFGIWKYLATNESAVVDLSSEEGSQTLTVPGIGVLFAETWKVMGDDYLVVGAIDSTDAYTLYRFADTDADGALDQSSRTTVLSIATGAYVTHIDNEVGGATYLLDSRCQDILRATDTDANGWIDTVETVPFARSDDFPQLLDASAFFVLDIGKIQTSDFGIPHLSVAASLPVVIYEDTDADGVADLVSTGEPLSVRPEMTLAPYDGLTSLTVYTAHYVPGMVAEVWALDSDNVDVSLLGSASFSGAGLENAVTVTISALSSGDRIGVRFANQGSTQGIVTVVDDYPQFVGADPSGVDEDVATLVTLSGVNFSAAMTLHVRYPDESGGTIPFAYVDANTITVNLPAVTPTDFGLRVALWATNPSQPAGDGAMPIDIQVCRAAAGN